MSGLDDSCDCKACRVTRSILVFFDALTEQGEDMREEMMGIMQAAAYIAAGCIRPGREAPGKAGFLEAIGDMFDVSIERHAMHEAEGAQVN